MKYITHTKNKKNIAEIVSDITIESSQDILDLMANIPSKIFILKKTMFSETFFDLKTGLAGEILQKCSNYFVKLAIVGDYTGYTSKSLKDFMYESNKTSHILFVESSEDALERFAG